MKMLAKGNSNKTILKILRILIQTSQSNFGDLDLDDGCIRDIADVITADVGEGIDQPAPSRSAAAQASPTPGFSVEDAIWGNYAQNGKGAIIVSTPQDAKIWSTLVNQHGMNIAEFMPTPLVQADISWPSKQSPAKQSPNRD